MTDEPRKAGDDAAEVVRKAREQLRSSSGKTEEELAEMFDPATAAAMVGRTDPRDTEWYREELEERWQLVAPKRYWRVSLDSPQLGQEEAFDTVREWVGLDPRPNLLICGPTGTGKTYLAMAAARRDHDAGRRIVFRSVGMLLYELRPGGGAMITDFVKADRLVLDDFGMSRSTEWASEQSEMIVNERWMDGLPTIVTTNLTPGEMVEAVGQRIGSRLCGSDSYVVQLVGDDRRFT